MKKIIIVNDGDIYGYIFSIFILKKIENVKLKFLKLNDNLRLKKDCVIASSVKPYYNNYNFNIDDVSNFRGTFSLNFKLNNFFDDNDASYICCDSESIDVKYIEFIKEYFNFNSKIKHDVYSLLYTSSRLSENNFFILDETDSDIIKNSNINFDNQSYKNYILKNCLEYKNFEYQEIDTFKKENNCDLYVDNTLDNILTTEKNINQNFHISTSSHQYKKEYQTISSQLKNYIEYDCGNIINENIFLYDYILTNEYSFDDNPQKVHDYFYKDNILNIGVSYFESDFNLFYDQVLHYYLIHKTIHMIEADDFRIEKINTIEKELDSILKNINYLISNLFLFSKKYSKNNLNVYNVDYKKLNINNHIFQILKSIHFDNDINYINFQNYLHVLLEKYDELDKFKMRVSRFASNQFEYLRQNVYKEIEEFRILR